MSASPEKKTCFTLRIAGSRVWMFTHFEPNNAGTDHAGTDHVRLVCMWLVDKSAVRVVAFVF